MWRNSLQKILPWDGPVIPDPKKAGPIESWILSFWDLGWLDHAEGSPAYLVVAQGGGLCGGLGTAGLASARAMTRRGGQEKQSQGRRGDARLLRMLSRMS